MSDYIYKQNDWPKFYWDNGILSSYITEVARYQGQVIGEMRALGLKLQDEAVLETMTVDIIKSTAIEGIDLEWDQVRSSVANRLGIEFDKNIQVSRDIEGIVDMMMDVTKNYKEVLSEQRLFDWHAALFPTGRSGMQEITVANWRKDMVGRMQVVSGMAGKEKVHYQAPKAGYVKKEMQRFINWFNTDNIKNFTLKSAIAHLWFVTIHPFEDGNGRIGRALSDMLLCREDDTFRRFYSVSRQIKKQRKEYYQILESTQKDSLDITKWLVWYFECLIDALKGSEEVLSKVIYKHDFWNKNGLQIQNQRQIKMLNKILDGFQGAITSSKWAKITKCSTDTALRDVQNLIDKGILKKNDKGGRSVSYEFVKYKQT